MQCYIYAPIHTCFTSIADVRNDKVEEPAGSPHQAYLIFIIRYHIHTTIKCQIITTRWMKMTTNMYVCIFIFWHVSDISVEAINLTYMIISSYYFENGLESIRA